MKLFQRIRTWFALRPTRRAVFQLNAYREAMFEAEREGQARLRARSEARCQQISSTNPKLYDVATYAVKRVDELVGDLVSRDRVISELRDEIFELRAESIRHYETAQALEKACWTMTGRPGQPRAGGDPLEIASFAVERVTELWQQRRELEAELEQVRTATAAR